MGRLAEACGGGCGLRKLAGRFAGRLVGGLRFEEACGEVCREACGSLKRLVWVCGGLKKFEEACEGLWRFVELLGLWPVTSCTAVVSICWVR